MRINYIKIRNTCALPDQDPTSTLFEKGKKDKINLKLSLTLYIYFLSFLHTVELFKFMGTNL